MDAPSCGHIYFLLSLPDCRVITSANKTKQQQKTVFLIYLLTGMDTSISKTDVAAWL